MRTLLNENLHQIRLVYNGLLKEKDNLVELATRQQNILNSCPSSLPDGTGIFTPESWIQWAKKELGY